MHCLIDDRQLKRFLQEDIPGGDPTSEVLIPKKAVMNASIIAGERGILCGMGIIKRLYSLINKSIIVHAHHTDGQSVCKGMKIAGVKGPARDILKGERTALNILQHLSGVATKTARYVNEIRGTKAHIYDTRKTTPGMRALQKYAVRCGGGKNHRMSLSDAVLVKDNHCALLSSYDSLARAMKIWRKRKKVVEIEADSFEHVRAFMKYRPDIIMLDNFSFAELKKAVAYIIKNRRKGKPVIEVSGGVAAKNLRRIARLGVERIAVGAITHSSRALDFNLDMNV